MQKKRSSKAVKKFEVSCARCRWTKWMSQKQWDNHMMKVHDFKNDSTLGMFGRKDET